MGRGGELSLNIQKPPRYVPEKPKADPNPKVSQNFVRKPWGLEIVIGICISVVGLLFLCVGTFNVVIRDHKVETAVLGAGLFSFGVLITYIGVCKYKSTVAKAQKRSSSIKEYSESDPISIASECRSESRSEFSKLEHSSISIEHTGYNSTIHMAYPINDLNKGGSNKYPDTPP